MYNSELKNKFLTSLSNAKCAMQYKNALDEVAEYELKIGKDIYQMGTDELASAMSYIRSVNNNTKRNKIVAIQKYLRWCFELGLIDNVQSISTSDVVVSEDNIRRHYFSSPDHLNNVLNATFPSKPEKSQFDVYKCWFWLAFIGIPITDTASITSSEVDIYNKYIEKDGVRYEIYDEAIPSITVCKEANELYRLKNRFAVLEKRHDGDKLLRCFDWEMTPEYISRTIRGYLSHNKCVKTVGHSLSYSDAYMSGHFYRMCQREKDGIPVDFSLIARTVVSTRGGDINRNKLSKTKWQYMHDYDAWKSAFGFA